jgi:dihydroflavonol-4-reductase
MKIAVTGASGHVGANLCRELLQQGHNVKALVHENVKSLEGLEIQFIKGDITEPDSLLALCRDTEIVFHLAAIISVNGNKKELEKINVVGTQLLLETVFHSNVRRLIHFSSIHAIDHNPLDQPMDETRPLVRKPLMAYEATKTAGERLVNDYIKKGLDAVVLNPSAIIGPYDFKPSLVGQVLIRLYNRKLPALVPGGYDWVDVRDVSRTAISAISAGKKGERYILSGSWMSVRDLAALMEDITGRKMVHTMIPMVFARIGVPFIKIHSKLTGQHPLYTFQSLDVLMQGSKKIMNHKAKEQLGFDPRPLRETVADAITWYKENGMLDQGK